MGSGNVSETEVQALAKAIKLDAVEVRFSGGWWYVYLRAEPKPSHVTIEKHLKARGWWLMASGYSLENGHYIACTTPELREAYRGQPA